MSAQIYMCYQTTTACDVDEQFKQDNPHFSSHSKTLHNGTPYIFRDEPNKEPSPQLQSDIKSFPYMHVEQCRNIAFMNAQLGSEVMIGLGELYENELLPASARLATWAQNEKNNLVGAGTSLLGSRASLLQKQLYQYENILGEIRRGYKKRIPKAEMVVLESKAKAQHNQLNAVFRQELEFLSNNAGGRRGTPLTNAQRGINQAKSARTSAPIRISTSSDFSTIKNLSTGLTYSGKGLLALDAFNRLEKVADDYNADRDWQKTAVVQSSGFIAGTYIGGATATVISSMTLGLAATPVGWVIAIGIGVTGTYFVSTKTDQFFQSLSADIYDYIR